MYLGGRKEGDEMAVDKVNLHQHFLALESIKTRWKCFVKFHVVQNTMAALSSIENVVCRV